MFVVKRDNTAQKYDQTKIYKAIEAAFNAVCEPYQVREIEDIITSLNLYNFINIHILYKL